MLEPLEVVMAFVKLCSVVSASRQNIKPKEPKVGTIRVSGVNIRLGRPVSECEM